MRVTMTLIIFALVIVVTVLAFLIRNMTLDFDITGKFFFNVHLKVETIRLPFCRRTAQLGNVDCLTYFVG